MAIKDWQITIDRSTRAISQAGFGKILILATSHEHPFTTYYGIDDVIEDFDETTEAYKMASRIFGQTPKPQEIAILGVGNGSEGGLPEPNELINALNNTDEEFYFLTCEDNSKNVVEALAEWTETQQKMYGFSTDDLELAESIETKGYDRTFFVVHESPESYPCEGWIGRCAPEEPGSITWNYKSVSGITISGVDSNEVKDLNGNTYIEQHGETHMYDGRTASGEWIDVIRSQDFLYTRIDESIFGTLLRAKKVPYTNTGIAMIEAAIEAPIMQAANNGMIAEEDGEYLYEITVPRRSDTTVNDRAQRLLPDIEAVVTLAGSVHGGEISLVIQI